MPAGQGFCPDHLRIVQRTIDQRRGSARSRGYSRAWEKARAAFLRAHPLCMCEECDEGRVRLTAAEIVDHKVPHRGDMKLFWDRDNWQSMAKACHDKKTAREDGGFGNRRVG